MMNRLKKHVRAFGRTVFLFLLVSLLLPFFFAAVHAEHDCTGVDCAVCAQIHDCSEVLKRLFGGLSNALPAVCLVSALLCRLPQNFYPLEKITPTGTKIRLNN
ncbi:MAG: hypothetical protein LBT65_05665 [Synergistaceae bacterium]|nr:hypothetical protein [Synergistaceae bacterium]